MSCRNRPATARPAFTLIELLVAIAIIATLAAVVAPSIFSNVGEARRSAAKAQLHIFALALDSYRIDTFDYPSTAQGLAALRIAPAGGAPIANWRGPYLRQQVPQDPWGRAYVYVAPGLFNPDSYDLYSLGRDGRPGGTAEDADITSWNGQVTR